MQNNKGKTPAVAAAEVLDKDPNQLRKDIYMTSSISEQTNIVDFHGNKLISILVDEVPYVAVKPICEAIGVDAEAQRGRIARHPVLSSVAFVTKATGSDGKSYDMLMLPLDKLNGFLFGINANRIQNQEVRERLIQYQSECFDVLANYWNKGVALNPRAFKQGKDDVLSVDESNILRNMIEKDAKMLFPDDKEKQGKFLRQGWSKLKSHFGVTYKQIPKHELTTAISILQRHGLEWQEAEPEFNVPMSHSNGAKHLKEFFQKCIDDVRKGGSYTDKQYIPLDVLKGFVLSQMPRFKMMTCFDSDSMTLQHYLIKEGSVMFDPNDEKQVRGMISEGIPKSYYPMIIGTIMNYFNEIDQERRRQLTHKQRLVTA